MLRYNNAFSKNIIQQRLDSDKLIMNNNKQIIPTNIDKNLEKSNKYNIAYQRIKRIRDRIIQKLYLYI